MAQNRDWQHSFRCKVCKTSKGLALGQSGIGSLKKHAEGDTRKNNIYMVLHKKTLNFFQSSSSKSIVIKDDDVSCYSHSNTQQGFKKPPTRPSQSIFDQGTTSITLFKDLLKGQSKIIFVQTGWGQTSKHIIFIVKKRTGRGRGFKNGNIWANILLNGPPISYIFQLFHHQFFRNCCDTHSSLSIFAKDGQMRYMLCGQCIVWKLVSAIYNSVDDFGDVLKHMCQTDPVSSKFQTGRTKLQYGDQPWFISTF